MAHVGPEIAKARTRQALSQRALARRAGISPEALRDIEAGRADPRTGTVQAIAHALGIPAAALLGWTGAGLEDVVAITASLPREDQESLRKFAQYLMREALDRRFSSLNVRVPASRVRRLRLANPRGARV